MSTRHMSNSPGICHDRLDIGMADVQCQDMMSRTPGMASMTVHEVLAGAYRGKRARFDALLTHASTDGGSTAVCGGVAEGNLCDQIVPGPPTCKACERRFRSS